MSTHAGKIYNINCSMEWIPCFSFRLSCHGLDFMIDYLNLDMWIFVGIRDVLVLDSPDIVNWLFMLLIIINSSVYSLCPLCFDLCQLNRNQLQLLFPHSILKGKVSIHRASSSNWTGTNYNYYFLIEFRK